MALPPPPIDKDEFKKRLDKLRESSQPSSEFRYPSRTSNTGSDLYYVQAGDSWPSIARSIYGDESYQANLKNANRSITTLHPGMRLVLPDRAIDPQVEVPSIEFWHGPEFAQDINAMDTQARIAATEVEVEKIWPDHGEEVYIGFDEENRPYPTTDEAGLPMFWDPEEATWSFEDTGIRYTMGMIENDFIKPLTLEERQELQLRMRERGFRADYSAYYAEGAESEDVQAALTEALPQGSAFVPTLHDSPRAMEAEIAWWQSAIDAPSLGEEVFRGIANIADRPQPGDEEGLDFKEAGMRRLVAFTQALGVGAGRYWQNLRGAALNLFGQDPSPWAVDATTGRKIDEDDVAYYEQTGRSDQIVYMDPRDYFQREMDVGVDRVTRWMTSAFDGHLTGVHPEDFESDLEYEDYLRSLYGNDVEDEATQQAAYEYEMRRQEEYAYTREQAEILRSDLMGQAFFNQSEGKSGLALDQMQEALKLSNAGATWYSPYFMWSEMNEPWRYEAFIEAVALLTLEHGEELEPRVVRTIRRQYEHAGLDIAMGITTDIFNILEPLKVGGTVINGIRRGVNTLSSVDVAVPRAARPISAFLSWLTAESHGSAATALKRMANNVSIAGSTTVDASISQPGIRGLDELWDDFAQFAINNRGRVPGTEIWDDLPPAISDMHKVNIEKLASMADETSEIPAVQKIHPSNWPALVGEARDKVWQAEYDRVLLGLRRNGLQGRSLADLEAQAARHADIIASDPTTVSREIGNFFEDAHRAQHATQLGLSTLDDNVIVEIAKKTGQERHLDNFGAQLLWRTFYGIRNTLFPFWLGLRPAWTVINFIDSTYRSLISTGGKLFDDLGVLHFVNTRRVLARGKLREEFLATFSRGVREVESEQMVRLEPAIDRHLRQRKFFWTPIHTLADAHQMARIEAAAERAGRVAENPLARALNFGIDQLKIGWRTLTRGSMNVNSLIEFGLRQRTFGHHFDRFFGPLDEFGLDEMINRLDAAGADDVVKDTFRKLWNLSNDDPEAFRALAERTFLESGAPNRVLHSELLPPDFVEKIDALGLDRRLRSLIIHPMIDDLENIIRNADPASVADEVSQYVSNMTRRIDDEFIRRAEELGSQPARASDEMAEGGGLAVAGDADEIINIGAGADETLNVTTQQLRVSPTAIHSMSEAHRRMGELQQESTARLFDAKRDLRNLAADGSMDEAVSIQMREYLDEISEQTRLYRDRVKQFFLYVFPGPLNLDMGPLRQAAWDQFDNLGTQVYESVVTFTDEAVEAAMRGEVDELPSIENLLLRSGIETHFEGQRLVSIRISDDFAGTRSAFSGWRGTNWMKKQLLRYFFGPRVSINNAGEFMRAPYTVDNFTTSSTPLTATEAAADLAERFGDMVGEATDRGIRAADEAWQAFVRNPDVIPGRTLREAFGHAATANRQAFVDYMDEIMDSMDDLYARAVQDQGQAAADSLGIRDVQSSIATLQAEVIQAGFSIDMVTNPVSDLLERLAPGIVQPPRWMVDHGVQTYLNMQRGLAAERQALHKTVEMIHEFISTGLDEGSFAITTSRFTESQKNMLQDFTGQAVELKQIARDIAADGIDTVRGAAETFYGAETDFIDRAARYAGASNWEGAVAKTQFDLLEYAKNYRFDNIIKAISPFWMFQSRSPIFWMKTFMEHPAFFAWNARYMRWQQKNQIQEGATTTSGRPLNRLYGFFRIPGTTTWVAPMNPLSSRYVMPRPNPYPGEFADDVSNFDIAVNHVYEYGRMFGFNPGPWLTYPLYWTGVLDEERFPIGSLISQIELVPPWIQRDIRRALNMSRYPNDPGLFSPDVGWKDFLIQKEMLGSALLELEENPDKAEAIYAELKEALGYEPTEELVTARGPDGDFVVTPTEIASIETVPFREHARWVAARDTVERSTYFNQLLGYFTGIYPKEYTDAEAELLAIRDELNFLKESINSTAGTVVFGLDPVAETRYEMYMDKQWDTPEGAIESLYGSVRWVEAPDGGQAYGDERNQIISQRIWENEVTQAYYDSLELLTDQFDACQKSVPIGSSSDRRRACWAQYFEGRARLDNEPVFDVARKDWAVGYKTDGMIQERFEYLWWSYIKSTRPHWYQQDGETYDSWKAREAEWIEELPMVAQELAPLFLTGEIGSRTGFEGEGPENEISGNRLLMEETLVNRLVSQTTPDGWAEWKLATDSSWDAMNDAWRALRWDPYMEAVQGFEQLNTYERELAERAFMEKHGAPPTFDEMARWVMETYGPDRFTVDELRQVWQDSGVTSIQERTLPNNELELVSNEIWEMLSAIGPGENFKVFEEAFIKAGADNKDLLDAWYETGGEFADYEMVQQLHDAINDTTSGLGIAPPSQDQLVEWAGAKRLQGEFKRGVEQYLGDGFFDILAIYGSLSGDAKRAYKKANEEALEWYFDAKEAFAKDNQLWAKYYYPDGYLGGVGLPGEGAEKRGEADPSGGRGGGRTSVRKSSFGRRGFTGRDPDASFLPQGHRATYNVSALFDPKVLGSGGTGGVPFWPAGWGKGKSPKLLAEVVRLIGDEEPLSDAAKDFLAKQKDPFSKEVLEFDEAITGCGGVVHIL